MKMTSPNVVQNMSPKNLYPNIEVLSDPKSSTSSGEVFKPKTCNENRDWYLYKRTQREESRIKELEDELKTVVCALSQTGNLETVLLNTGLLKIDTIRPA